MENPGCCECFKVDFHWVYNIEKIVRGDKIAIWCAWVKIEIFYKTGIWEQKEVRRA